MLHERVLVVDDDAEGRMALANIVRLGGYQVAEAADGLDALEKLASFDPDVVLTDLRMPRLDGLSLLRRAREAGSTAVFLVLTGHGSIEAAVEAMRFGAEQFLTKPPDVDATLLHLEKALERRQLVRDSDALKQRLRQRGQFPTMIGDSAEMQAVFDIVQQSAATKATVLVLGESGTGKELVVQALHEASPRRGKPFVKLNCAALPDTLLESELFGHEKGAFTGAVARKSGRFERAHGGTLFLDEIGDISAATQVRLLRALQQKEFERVGGTETIQVDVRLVAATNKDLAEEVSAGRFREDLYYRLNVVTVTLPPLRQRKADIPALANHFLARFAAIYQKRIEGLAPGTLDALLMYEWPGNVRELENAIERAVVLCKASTLRVEDLPPALKNHNQLGSLHGPMIPGSTLYDVERYVILRTLDAVGGSTSRAAAVLGISTRKVQYKLKEYAALQQAQSATEEPEAEPPGEGGPDEEPGA